MADVTKPWVLITGASSGIGASIARDLSLDSRLLLHGRDRRKLEAVRAECANSDFHAIWVADFASAEDVGASLACSMQQDDVCPSHFIHCAGEVVVQPTRQMSVGSIRRLFDVNVLSVFAMLPALLAPGGLRSMVVVSSAASLCGEKGVAAYTAAKGALNAMTRSLAVELAPAIKVNAVLPGLVDTPMASAALTAPAAGDWVGSRYPLGLGHPRDIAAVVRMLLSSDTPWITGQCVAVDGGRTLV